MEIWRFERDFTLSERKPPLEGAAGQRVTARRITTCPPRSEATYAPGKYVNAQFLKSRVFSFSTFKLLTAFVFFNAYLTIVFFIAVFSQLFSNVNRLF